MLKLYERNTNPRDLQQVIDILNDGGVIIYPTDTRYAMGCHGLKERAVERICRLKGIDPRKNNLSIICKDLSMVSEYAKMNNNTFKLLKKNLPGPFTFILNTGNNLPKIYKNRKEVGIRIPDNNILLQLTELLEAPIMTSTLHHDEDEDEGYVTHPELINDKFSEIVDLIIDGGEGDSEESTIVDCLGDSPVVTRQGKGWLDE